MIRDVWLICVANFIGAFGDGLYFYVFPNYVRSLGATPAEVGIAFSVLSLASVFTPLPGGLLADLFDRKKVMILGWLIWLPVPLIFSLANNWITLLPGMFLYGFFLSGPASSAYVASAVKKSEVTTAFTAVSASWWLGYVFSPSLGAYVSALTSFSWVFYLASLFYLLPIFVLLFISSQYAGSGETESEESEVEGYSVKGVLLWSLFLASVVFALYLIRPLIPQLLADFHELDTFHVGVIGSCTFLGATFWCLFLGRVGDRWRKSGAVFAGLCVSALAVAILVVGGSFGILLFVGALLGASYTVWSLVGAIVGPLAPPRRRGWWISVSQTGATLASLIAVLVGGFLYEASVFVPFIAFIFGALVLAIIGLVSGIRE